MTISSPYSRSSFPVVAVVFLVLVCGCSGDSSVVDSGNEQEESIPLDTLEEVPPDGRLEAVTWNLEWYGEPSRGPADEQLQTANILEVIDSLKADLYAFQEVRGPSSLRRITDHMKGYRGFVAEFINQTQRTAFVFNSLVIDSLSSGAITERQDSFDWASGRFPMFFSFNYTVNNSSVPIYAVVIHAKAFDDQESYERRQGAADSLHAFLQDKKPDANILFLGDYNDDVDESIFDGADSPYYVFVTDNQHFQVVTKALSDNGISSTVSFPDMVDHITISDELFDNYLSGSEDVFNEANNFIDSYGSTTSDHFPVWVRLDLTNE